MRPRLVAWLLVVPLALSGCVDDDGTGNEDDAPVDPRVAAGTYEEWTVSEYWDFDISVRGFDRYDTTRLIYYDKAGEEFTVGTPYYDEALYHAIFSFNPLLGRVHANLLSPHEEGNHAHMFPFHKSNQIEDGDEWTTNFFAHRVTIRTTYDESVPAPGGATPGYRFVATDPNDAKFKVEYSYVRALKWFSYLKVTDADGVFVDMTTTGHGTGATGAAHFIRAEDYLHETIQSSGPLQTSKTFSVSASDLDGKRVESFAISAGISLQSGVGATLRLRGPDNGVIWEKQYDADQDGETNIQEIFPTGAKSDAPVESRPQWPAGTYTLQFSYTGQATADVHIVGTQDNSGRV